MDRSRLVMLLLATAVLSCGTASAQQTARPAPKPTASAPKPTASAPKPSTTTPRAAAPSSSKDPFVGVWKLSAKKSKYEQGSAPTGFTRTLEDRGGGTIFMTIDVNVQGTPTRSYLVYKRDGRPYPEAAVGADAIRMVTVRSINPRTEEVSFIVNGKPSANTITISSDGMTMTQVLNGTTAKGQAYTNTLVYDRQGRD